MLNIFRVASSVSEKQSASDAQRKIARSEETPTRQYDGTSSARLSIAILNATVEKVI